MRRQKDELKMSLLFIIKIYEPPFSPDINIDII